MPLLLRSTCRLVLAIPLAVAAWAASSLAAEGETPEQSLARMRVADGFEVSLFAAEPMIRQPISMTFDRRGRMWVIQYLQYPNPAGLKAVKVDKFLRTVYDRVPEPPPKGPKGVDRITILEDTDGDGRADKSHDFLNDLNLATGMALGHGGVFVAQSPYLLFYPDKNRDDVPDGPPEVLLSGFGMEDSHAFPNSLQWGPDGWLYGAQGSTVTATIRGITFQQGIWRYHPVTKAFELFAEGGGNTWGVDFDRHGNLMAGTNYGGVAMLHQVQGGYYVKNFGKHGELQNPYAFGYFEHVPYPDFKGGHVTCGGIVYQGGLFPEKFRNHYIAANLLSNVIDWHIIEPKGSSFVNRRGGELMGTDDTWFRPVDCQVGPDGDVFIADWYDKRANHVDPKDDWDKTNGRIYRLRSKGAKPAARPETGELTADTLQASLKHPNNMVRREARRELAESPNPQFNDLLKKNVVEAGRDALAIESLWALYVNGGFDEAYAKTLLTHPNEDVRVWAVRLVGDTRRISASFATDLGMIAQTDPSPVVRSQIACTCKRMRDHEWLPVLAALLKHDEDVNDPHLPLLSWWALESKADTHVEGILAMLSMPKYRDRPLVKQVLIERLARRYAAGTSEASLESCAKMLALAPDAADAEPIIRGMEKGLEGRKFAKVPEVLEKPLDDLWMQAVPFPKPALARLAMRLGSEPAYRYALFRASDRESRVPDRVALVEALGQMGKADDPQTLTVIFKLLEFEPAALQMAAITALERFPNPEIGEKILAGLSNMNPPLRARALSLLCGRQAWALALLNAVDAKQIDPKEISTDLLQRIALQNDKELNKLIEKHWGKIQQQTTGEKMARIHGLNVSLRMTPGDPTRGKPLFTKHCAACHNLFGEGNKIGPELTGADRKNLNFLLTNIVDPSAVIRKEFFSHTVQMNDGRVLVGLIAESTPTTVTILDAKNQRTVLATSEIDEIEQSPLSLMPEKILDPLSVQEVRDLFSYLQSNPSATPDGKK